MPSILIVDDSKELLEMFYFMFTKQGFKCGTADSPESLYKQLQTKLPDLLLIDVRLNGTDGREICKELKTRNAFKTIPVVLMSSSPNKLNDYRNFKADAVLEKPFEMENLFGVVDHLLQVH